MGTPNFSKAYVDCDVLRYVAGWSVEYKQYRVEGLDAPLRGKTKLKEYLADNPEAEYEEEEVLEPVQNAIQIMKNRLAFIEGRCKCELHLVISGKTNFRDDIATIKPYKGNRPDRKPQHFQALTDWLLGQGATVTDGIEADDYMAIMQYPDTVICTIDKDLLQVPGWHYNWDKDAFQEIDQLQGDFNLCVQIIAGDSTDNIQGIPGKGIAKAEKALQDCDTTEEMYETVVHAYFDYYGESWEHFMTENAKLVYMLRTPDDEWVLPIEVDEADFDI